MCVHVGMPHEHIRGLRPLEATQQFTIPHSPSLFLPAGKRRLLIALHPSQRPNLLHRPPRWAPAGPGANFHPVIQHSESYSGQRDTCPLAQCQLANSKAIAPVLLVVNLPERGRVCGGTQRAKLSSRGALVQERATLPLGKVRVWSGVGGLEPADSRVAEGLGGKF